MLPMIHENSKQPLVGVGAFVDGVISHELFPSMPGLYSRPFDVSSWIRGHQPTIPSGRGRH